ncbi:response regulator [Arenicella xantha]|uniref:Response regulator receiver domain-containing protein n=1 Tax=Arenicella xantha TaxID=644221 RepID=A0A395JGM0_9GAMM|nr:response regulator [Arenicella xantha]RBP49130.1 response regulator receiver domain-containing protein [Arenicella xantha]
MPTKTALIVDDSKTAHFKLKRILQRYDLSIDLAFSAEDALSYLSYRIPDVIFMDHSMRGMNGLEAIKIIKSNPATSNIPISMYTAESGDEYVRQARAAGAIDVLSKDIMTDLDVDRVVKHVNVGTLLGDIPPIEHDGQGATIEPLHHTELTPDLAAIRDQVASSMDIQQRRVRREIQDNTRVLINRFMREFRVVRDDVARHQKQQQTANTKLLSELRSKPRSKQPNWMYIGIGILTALALFSLIEMIKLRQEVSQLRAASASNQAAEIESIHAPIDDTSARPEGSSSSSDFEVQLNNLNLQSQFGFAEQALSGDRIRLVSDLLDSLDQTNFKGTLSLELHHGNFCTEADASGSLILPSEPLPVTQCQLISDTSRTYTSSTDTSVQFANMIDSADIIERGDLRLDLIALGVSAPSYQYPQLDRTTSSTEWNAVAAANNRITATLQPR